MLNNRLKELGSFYGNYSIHDKLWNNCIATKDDSLGRICIISLVQEARGLDAGPRLVSKLKSQGDTKSAAIIEKIVSDEVKHVQIGLKWYMYICKRDNLNPEEQFKSICAKYLKTKLQPPFNISLRDKSGLPSSWYLNKL
jgi:uncharacterized ferritin-like protein (DUF455 family)